MGDGLQHANLSGQPLTLFDPHQTQTINGVTGNFYFNPGAFSNAQVGDGTCTTPSSSCFPSTDQVVANPSLATYGSLPRNFFRGPGRVNVDFSVAKVTSITERLKLEIRGDAFNLFNHAEFANPSTNIASSRFGRITTTGDTNPVIDHKERIVQLAARFTF